MTHRSGARLTCLLGLLALLILGLGSVQPAEPSAEGVEFFEKKIRPLLVEKCVKCHGPDKQKGGLRLDSKLGLYKGGDNGKVVVPGDAERSLLVKAVRYQDEPRMPPKSKLPETAIANLASWVKMGAPWPEDKATVVTKNNFNIEERKKHWCWQPVRPLLPPEVGRKDWPLSPIDAFLLAKLEAKNLAPAPAADKRTLIRRVTFDLTGLPPAPEEIDAFLLDEAPDAFARVVDRLLASPRYGERWARHWLDLVRYGESRGHEFDYIIPNAYQYRDYVIRALNADVPYRQFVTEHVAGDLLDQPRLHPSDGYNESILGTGFWFLGEEVHSPVDIRQDEADRFDNRIDVMTKTFLGLTVSCARCHDHKFDAISTKDYYSLFGFLESSGYRLVRFDSREHNQRVARDLWQLRQRDRGPLQKVLAEALRPGVERMADYLLAAREATAADPRKLDALAADRKLDPALLAKWVSQISTAARDENDPLHAWGKVAPRDADGKQLTDLLRPPVESGRKRQADADNALKGVDVVIDYAKPSDWLPDDVSFGPGPVRSGDLRFGNDPSRPVLGFHERAAAVKDPTWDGLRLAPGSEIEPGGVGRMERPGRTLRTPSFTLTGGKAFYLVRGTGIAYAAVGQHVMINGPLHARLVLNFKTGERFQWVVHDLTPYQGQRLHIEFTGADGSDFGVAMVAQGTNGPGVVDPPNRQVLRLLESDAAASPEQLAAGYRQMLLETVEQLATDRINRSADAARLANWLVQKRDLFMDEAGSRRLAEVAAPLLEAQKKLTDQIKRDSHLAPAMLDGNGVDDQVFIRGSPKALGVPAPRRFLEALAGDTPLSVPHGSGRLELARQMIDPVRNPLIARVMVNRLWHHLFGRGLVTSVDNFGVLGEKPTHPELLDYLADRFVQDGWSVKKMVRLLVLSRAYQMESKTNAEADAADPENLLLHRMRIRRLEGEAIRDAMLAISGRLNEKMYGPSVPVHLNAFQDGRGKPASGPLDGDGRRSLYLAVRRNFLSSFLLAFDTPIPFSTVGRRTVSNVPAQALILMNDPFVHSQAETWAKRVRSQAGTAQERVEHLYQSAYGRPPRAQELAAALAFVAESKADEARAWADLCHVLFNAKEFIFLE
jgi:hypothetical protein